MKLQNVTDLSKLFETIDSCTGRVELVGQDGERFNLKSKLSQFAAVAKTFSQGKVREMELLCSEPSDVNLLLDFMMAG